MTTAIIVALAIFAAWQYHDKLAYRRAADLTARRLAYFAAALPMHEDAAVRGDARACRAIMEMATRLALAEGREQEEAP